MVTTRSCLVNNKLGARVVAFAGEPDVSAIAASPTRQNSMANAVYFPMEPSLNHSNYDIAVIQVINPFNITGTERAQVILSRSTSQPDLSYI